MLTAYVAKKLTCARAGPICSYFALGNPIVVCVLLPTTGVPTWQGSIVHETEPYEYDPANHAHA
jgi:hypothetical protein